MPLVTILIFVGVLLVLVVLVIAIANSLRRTQVVIRESDAGIDVALTKRYDLLTKLFDVTKGYAKHEEAMFSSITGLRAGMSMAEKNAANSEMDAAKLRINAVAEAYPDLRSSEQFSHLQAACADAEEHLQAARRVYNSNVSRLNQALVSFPSSLVGSLLGIQQQPFFEAEAQKQQDVNLSF